VKKLYIPIIVMAVLLVTACGHRATGTNGDGDDSATVDSSNVAGETTLRVDSVGAVYEDTAASAKVIIFWPVSGNEALVASIRQYICEEIAASITLEGKPDVVTYDDGQKAADATAKHQFDDLKSMWHQSQADNIPTDGMQYSYALRIKLDEQTDRYVTYSSYYEGFLGGAHGGVTARGLTFRKSDGKRIGYHTEYNSKTEQFELKDQTLFADPTSPKLYAIIKEGVRSYLQDAEGSTVTDQQMKEELQVSDINRIPLPSVTPVFTRQGLSFVYQQYEIAAYAMGMPNFFVGYDKIRPLLTSDAAELIEK